jgi:hypothetical protein
MPFTDFALPKDTEMPYAPWSEIQLHADDYIHSCLLPTGLVMQCPDNMVSHDLLAHAATFIISQAVHHYLIVLALLFASGFDLSMAFV